MNKAALKIKMWRENPAQFVWDNFKAKPDLWQQRVLDAFVSNKTEDVRISLQACAG